MPSVPKLAMGDPLPSALAVGPFSVAGPGIIPCSPLLEATCGASPFSAPAVSPEPVPGRGSGALVLGSAVWPQPEA